MKNFSPTFKVLVERKGENTMIEDIDSLIAILEFIKYILLLH